MADWQPRSSPALKKGGPAPSPRSTLLVRIAEVLSIISATAFMASSLLCSLVFSTWRLNFFQLATPSDVVMAGLDLLARAWPLLLVPAVAFGLAHFSRATAFWALFGSRRKLEEIEGARLVMLAAAVLFTALLVDGLPTGLVRYFTVAFTFLLVLLALNGAYVLFVAAKGGLFRAKHGLSADADLPKLRRWREALVAVGLAALVAVGAVVLVQRLSLEGFPGRALYLTNPQAGGCLGRVLWVGERAIVVECRDAQLAVLSNPENAQLSSKRPSWAAETRRTTIAGDIANLYELAVAAIRDLLPRR